MKIAISYPPLESPKGTPLLAQNRQFQWFSDPTYIYPMIPASAATLLKANSFEVFWDDAIAEGLSYEDWKKRILAEKPDLIAIETKTPVVKKHWRIIDELKSCYELRATCFVLIGDHVSALPQESFENSEVDFVICGGDYDFLLLNLAKKLSGEEELKGGIWYRDGRNNIVNSGKYDPAKNSLNNLPMIDRELTKWQLYAEKNGNYKYTPGTYVMNARDCWWGKCSFCSWTTMFPGEKFRARSVQKALDEIGELVKLGVKEIMEDSGTLPVGQWLEDFCGGMIERGYNQKIVLDCNLRVNAISNSETWKLMKGAGFRMILFGIESVSQETLDRINKNLKVEEIEPALKMAKSAGLEPHITFMLGWPWESKKDAENTVNFAKRLFKKNYINTLQATIAVPYPGTPLYDYCQKNDLLLTEDYDRFDQSEPVMKSPLTAAEIKKMTRELYRSFLTPQFIFRKIKETRNLGDLKFLGRAGKKFLSHLKDFSREDN